MGDAYSLPSQQHGASWPGPCQPCLPDGKTATSQLAAQPPGTACPSMEGSGLTEQKHPNQSCLLESLLASTTAQLC